MSSSQEESGLEYGGEASLSLSTIHPGMGEESFFYDAEQGCSDDASSCE